MNSYLNVSIIVPVYNAEATVEECIKSILELDYPKKKLELIFVNNNSNDDTGKILKKYESEIKILYENKRGPAAARNRGLKNAEGDIVALTDSDCIADKEWIKNIIIPLKDDNVGISGGKILARVPYNKIEKFGESVHNHEAAINHFKPPYVITMNWASRISVLNQMNFFNEEFIRCEDIDLSHRIYSAGYKIVYAPDAVVYHRNEKTLSGLFREGYLHGKYSVQFIKQYQDFFLNSGHRRINFNSYKKIATDFKEYFTNGKDIASLCSAVFNSGKKAGKILGSLKYSYLDI